jgi:hypothetical protein
MVNAFESLFSGIILGLVAGLSPGPMLALVIAETLKFGKEEGFKVAVSPLITDSTIVLLTLLALSTLAEHILVIGLISMFGACYLIHLGLENLRTKTSRFEVVIERKEAFKRAIITNLLNPHTYLFLAFCRKSNYPGDSENRCLSNSLFLARILHFSHGFNDIRRLCRGQVEVLCQEQILLLRCSSSRNYFDFFAFTILIEGLKLLALL